MWPWGGSEGELTFLNFNFLCVKWFSKIYTFGWRWGLNNPCKILSTSPGTKKTVQEWLVLNDDCLFMELFPSLNNWTSSLYYQYPGAWSGLALRQSMSSRWGEVSGWRLGCPPHLDLLQGPPRFPRRWCFPSGVDSLEPQKPQVAAHGNNCSWGSLVIPSSCFYPLAEALLQLPSSKNLKGCIPCLGFQPPAGLNLLHFPFYFRVSLCSQKHWAPWAPLLVVIKTQHLPGFTLGAPLPLTYLSRSAFLIARIFWFLAHACCFWLSPYVTVWQPPSVARVEAGGNPFLLRWPEQGHLPQPHVENCSHYDYFNVINLCASLVI